MEILLVLRVELGPDYFFKAVGLCVNEFGVLRDWQVGVPSGGQMRHLSYRIVDSNTRFSIIWFINFCIEYIKTLKTPLRSKLLFTYLLLFIYNVR